MDISLRTPVLRENFSVTEPFMETSLPRTPLSLYCKDPLIADTSGMDMSSLRTLHITDTTH